MLAVAMLVTSALIALDLTVLMRTPLHVVATDSEFATGNEHEPLLRSFYDAANAILSGEPSALLATVVSPDVETHAGAGFASHGERGVRDYLAGLRQRGAGSLSVVRLIGAGEEIAVVIEAHEPPSAGTDAADEPSLPRWRTVDLFRIAAGMVVGYWPGAPDHPASRSLPSLSMPASAEMMAVSLARLELAPGAEPTPLFASVPHLLIVETGSLSVSRNRTFEIARAGASRFVVMAADPDAEEFQVGPGDALLFPEVVAQSVRNPGASSASAFSLLVAPNELIFHQVRAGQTSKMTVEAMHDGWRIGRRTMWDNNVVTEPLAVKHLPPNRRLDNVSLSSSPISLEAGQRNPPLTPGKLRLAIVRSGFVGVSVINSDAVPISSPRPDSALAVAANHLFLAGDAFWIENSEAPVLANAGVTPLEILLIEVAPFEDESGATPTSSATAPQETNHHSMPPRAGSGINSHPRILLNDVKHLGSPAIRFMERRDSSPSTSECHKGPGTDPYHPITL